MRPGSAPLDRLAEALAHGEALAADQTVLRKTLELSSFGLLEAVRQAKLQEGESLLVVVDQFEELFRFHRDQRDGEGEAQLFVASLLEAANAFRPAVYVVLTMRSDFLGDCSQFPGLPEALNESQYLVPRLTREQRREAIEKPLALVGARMTASLVQRLLYELGDDPDQLPVLQHALNRTWREWKSEGAAGDIEYRHYEKAGTLQGALHDHAKGLMEGLPEAAVGKVFRCLTTLDGGRAVRRPASFERIVAVAGGNEEAVRAVVERYADPENSLLVLSPAGKLGTKTMVDIAHESLIRRWVRLGVWVEEEADCVRWYADAAEDLRRIRRGRVKIKPWRDPARLDHVSDLLKSAWNAAWADWSGEEKDVRFVEVKNFIELGIADQAAEQAEKEAERQAKLDTERQAREAAQARAAAEQEAKEAALAMAAAESREKEQAHALVVAERSRKKWLATGLGGAVLFATAAAVGFIYYRHANTMQKELSHALNDEGKAQDLVRSLMAQIDYYSAEQAKAPSPQEASRLMDQMVKAESERFAAEGQLRAARARIQAIAQRSETGSATLPSPGPAPNDPPRKMVLPRDGLTYVWIPAGSFNMGCAADDRDCENDEKPAHRVRLLSGFWIGQTEVTQAGWKRVMGTDPSRSKADNLPVETVSWDDANSYCQAIGGRLPTEAEWEYAARAESMATRYGPLDEVAWYIRNSNRKTHAVGSRKPNALGLYDMLGNLLEWVSDWYGPYGDKPVVDPRGPSTGLLRVLRGGSWYYEPESVRVSYRVKLDPAQRAIDIGFRCAGDFR